MYLNNMNTLKRLYPYVYKIMKSEKCDSNYEILSTKTNYKTLKVNDFGLEFYIHSKYNPLKESQRFFENNYKNNIKNFIIIGFGLGYHIENFLYKIDNKKIFVFEFNKKIFNQALLNMDLISILKDDRLELIISDNLTSYINKLKEILNKEDEFEIIFHTQSMKAIPNQYKEIKYLLEEFRMKKKLVGVEDLLIENFNSNIKNVDRYVNDLFNKMIDVPAFLISAGPSLDKNINELKKIKNKGLILCVGRAVKALLNKDIVPDAIIITDPYDIVYEQIQGLNIFIPIIILSTCNKKVALNYKGKKYIAFQKGFKNSEELANKNNYSTVETGGSVATTALDILIKFGCDPIVFVGQDLAFSEEKTHSEQANHLNVSNKNTLRKVLDVNGKEVYTSKNLFSYLRWIQNRIQKEKSITFIDSTEGGARINGTDLLSLKESIKKYCCEDISDNINLL
ncbi:motility associated factor glycosyltransferase family protein [Senegalia massiliensis]|uniref:motility associated factor glycosyltransferase family protein n=1 Tax=Senegalia massiliensis TaxID=1720316 RepID=UPI001031A0AF|nr:6-hydroxymethylpterin diphosphokinase MptE-like protein [Senegalia massiliensis]